MSLGAVQILQKSLEDAQKGLTNTDDEIKKLTGREPQARPGLDKKRAENRLRAWAGEYVPPAKRRQSGADSRSRISDRLGERKRSGTRTAHSDEEDEHSDQSNLKSSVIAAPVPPRPTGDPAEDKTSKKRNQRMFGFLMGTLQKFQKDSNQKSEQEKRRAEIEEKLEIAAAKEKQELAKQKKELYDQRRQQQQRIGLLANQVEMAETYEEWNAHDQRLIGFIKTKSKPSIFYLPVEHNEETEKRLEDTKKEIEDKIAERKAELEKIACENEESPPSQEMEVIDSTSKDNMDSNASKKSRNKATLGRDSSSNDDSDQD